MKPKLPADLPQREWIRAMPHAGNAVETPAATALFPNAPHMLIPSPERRQCHWCGDWFDVHRDSQKFCKPKRERKLNSIRKKALVGALARQFRILGLRARDLLVVAQKCVDAAYEGVLKAMIRLGWCYDVKAEVWVLAGRGVL